ncbi:hypothetical protein [Anaerovibrio lipolyticus]|uniref:hypothetical protein n=1 Tax=Anaerovibrio lipolyticus TaxID=82374 RepID=UPI0026F016A5|nr:hypothetical protein [Anaerovibrio lipolyticus]
MSNFSKLIKIKKLPGSSKMIKWYSMIECEAQIDSEKYIVPLPASFLKQIGIEIKGVNIDDDDFMVENNQYILAHKDDLEKASCGGRFSFERNRYDKLNPFMPYDKSSSQEEMGKVKKYWDKFLPKYLKSDKFYEKLYKIIRIASCTCIFSCYEGKEIYGIKGIIDLYLEGNWISLSPASTNIFNIREAVLGKGKIIGPLHDECYFTGWEIISMIYAMIWSNSNIKNDENEFMFLVKVLSKVANIKAISLDENELNNYNKTMDKIIKYTKACSINNENKSMSIMVDKFIRDVEAINLNKNEFEDVGELINARVAKRKMSVEAWLLIFLYIRNIKWHYEYINSLMPRFNYKKFVNVDWEELYLTTQEWIPHPIRDFYNRKHVSTNEFRSIIVKELKKLPRDKYQFVAKTILDEDAVEKRSDNQEKIENKIDNVINLWGFTAVTLMKDNSIELYPFCVRRYEVHNIFFWILVECKIYNTFLRGKMLPSNNLDFIRKNGEYSTYSKDAGGTSIVNIKKGMKNAIKNHTEEDFYKIFPYLYIYLPLTKYVREGIINGVRIGTAYKHHQRDMGRICYNINKLLQKISHKVVYDI